MTTLSELAWLALEREVVPDPLVRAVIRRLCADRLREQAAGGVGAQHARKMAFIRARSEGPIARHTEDANRQHYEVPAAFYQTVLGPRLKYSSGYWPEGVSTLAAAEEAMLTLTCARAQIVDGQQILDLGCGWGALSLWLAEKYPRAQVTGLSNSSSQRAFIEGEAARRGLANLKVITCDVNELPELGTFDRILSVEMFEHLWNVRSLLARLATHLTDDGALFVHIFTHAHHAYPFEDKGRDDWMARNFFTGGSMPSDDLLLHEQRDLVVDDHWVLDGTHYARTAEAWLANLDAARAALAPVMASAYGPGEVARWTLNWRLFFIACAEMFGYAEGQEWWVSHYLFRRRSEPGASQA